MMSGRRSSSTYDMRPFETQSMMSSIRMEDPGNFMTQFMRTERGLRATQGSHNYTYDEKKKNLPLLYLDTNPSMINKVMDISHFIALVTGVHPSTSETCPNSSEFKQDSLERPQWRLFNMGASLSDGNNNYHFLKYPGSFEMNNLKVIGTIPSRFPNHIGFFHAYGMTENYLIFCEQPCGFDVRHFGNNQRLSGDYGMEYIQGESNYFYIMDKRTGRRLELSYMTDKPYFFYNFVNCYEYDNHVVIDVMGFEGTDFSSSMRSSSSRFFRERYSSSKIMRFRIPLSTSYRGMELTYSSSSCRDSSIMSHGSNRNILRPQYLFCESELMYPCINPNYNSRKYQYTYGQSGNSIIKFDVEKGHTLIWRGENEFWRPFRSMFVPNPSGRYEDDGILITCVSTSRGDSTKNYMIFIDAHSMKEVSCVHLDSPFPMGSSDSFYSPYCM
ncbi:beta,beta-carotene 15,15'-dioxygenase-like [Lepeophtheirus salmonis]|uniref:beta,beta-carotene 15,15'-dioxygenase-like n=1 Tax=Lepeophtheirus salmonis TaxID=72036 RepID=UPI001AE3A46E|nr:beta,beta-carotene 15,15'-dioxygenase-like [Lepeophtheirus salmonis]